MNKYIILLFTFFVLISCNSQQQLIQTKKKSLYAYNSKKSAKPANAGLNKSIEKVRPTASVKIYPKKKQFSDTTKVPATEVIVSTSLTKVTVETLTNYILKYKDIAMNNMRSNGIPASIILAQAILESGAGNGDLARDANNHFGIKCHKDWTGESIRHDDDSEQECFRKYNHAAESFQDHATFLSSRGRYNSLFKLAKSDYRSWARGLREAGYATDPRYPEKLITYIQKYNLDQYDHLVLGTQDTIATEENIVDSLQKIPLSIDNSDKHQVQKGETFYSISKKYNVTVNDLKLKNKLEENVLSVGQVLIIK